MENERIVEIIRANVVDGRLQCARAYQLATEHNLKLWQIGKVCEEEKIKIAGCQLGCF
ncbi:MAG: hypothetical protein NUK65_04025 [Firmicutes bacterium]|nr:hypothetical protein [Bacillota bacterium]